MLVGLAEERDLVVSGRWYYVVGRGGNQKDTLLSAMIRWNMRLDMELDRERYVSASGPSPGSPGRPGQPSIRHVRQHNWNIPEMAKLSFARPPA
jgi:hypothetical protein